MAIYGTVYRQFRLDMAQNRFDQLNFNLLNSSISVNEQLLWENLLLSWDNL